VCSGSPTFQQQGSEERGQGELVLRNVKKREGGGSRSVGELVDA